MFLISRSYIPRASRDTSRVSLFVTDSVVHESFVDLFHCYNLDADYRYLNKIFHNLNFQLNYSTLPFEPLYPIDHAAYNGIFPVTESNLNLQRQVVVLEFLFLCRYIPKFFSFSSSIFVFSAWSSRFSCCKLWHLTYIKS